MNGRKWLALLVGLGAAAVLAQGNPSGAAATGGVTACEEATTLFHDISMLGRKDRAARNMSTRHAEMAAQGWRYADTEAYTENGDLEGFFITYTRAVHCP